MARPAAEEAAHQRRLALLATIAKDMLLELTDRAKAEGFETVDVVYIVELVTAHTVAAAVPEGALQESQSKAAYLLSIMGEHIAGRVGEILQDRDDG